MEEFFRMRDLATDRRAGHKGAVPLSKATIWRKSGDGTFPRAYKLSTGVTVWKKSEVAAWLAACCDARDEVTA